MCTRLQTIAPKLLWFRQVKTCHINFLHVKTDYDYIRNAMKDILKVIRHMINVECTCLTIFETSLKGFSGLQILVMLNWVNDKVIHASIQFKHVMSC